MIVAQTAQWTICSEIKYWLIYYIFLLIVKSVTYLITSKYLYVLSIWILTRVLPKVEVRPMLNCYIWGEDSELFFQQALCSHFLDTQFDNQRYKLNVDCALENLTNTCFLIMIATDKSLKRFQRKTHPIACQQILNCMVNLRQLKANLKRCGRLVCYNPHDYKLMGRYHILLKSYNRPCKAKHRQFKSRIMDMMETLH